MTLDDKLLSIYGSHDASATFVDKDDNLRILELERFCNTRYAMYSSRFDYMSIGTNPSLRCKYLKYIKSQIKNTPELIVYSSVLTDDDIQLIKEYFPSSKLESFDAHHMSHSCGSYFQSPFRDALIFTIDGGGSDFGMHTTTKVYTGVDNEISEIHKSDVDFGNAYSLIGKPISEISPANDGSDLGVFLTYAGKVMGLCAYGKVVEEWIAPIERFYLHRNLSQLENEIRIKLSVNALSGENSYNLAATSQYVFENMLMDFILKFFNERKTNIVLTGGCALNVLFNQKLRKLLNSEGYELYVPPNPNDCGQSIGQYLTKTKTHIDPLVYSGFDILDREHLNDYLERGNYNSKEYVIEDIFNLISDGKIGGIIQGYSEVGPRALGNRSIICDPSFKDMKDVLNAKVKFREWFRPFAPVCREEDMHDYFDDAFPSEYMSYAPFVKEEYRDKLPSITHNDGTARLQTVNSTQHKLFYELLSFMKEKNRIPVILNTSFNIKGRPILTTVMDALHVLDNTELDFVVIENLLVTKDK